MLILQGKIYMNGDFARILYLMNGDLGRNRGTMNGDLREIVFTRTGICVITHKKRLPLNILDSRLDSFG